MSYSALSASFEYLCYGATAIVHIFTLTVRGSTLVVRIWRLQILTTKVDPRAVRVQLHYCVFPISKLHFDACVCVCRDTIRIENSCLHSGKTDFPTGKLTLPLLNEESKVSDAASHLWANLSRQMLLSNVLQCHHWCDWNKGMKKTLMTSGSTLC